MNVKSPATPDHAASEHIVIGGDGGLVTIAINRPEKKTRSHGRCTRQWRMR
jgi:hypothetical protein